MKIGALVRLRSGGPVLTVTEVADGKATCTWFQSDEFKNTTFPLAALAPYPEAAPSVIDLEGSR